MVIQLLSHRKTSLGRTATILAILGVGLLFGCNSSQQQNQKPNISANLSGAGASFPAPVYKRWFSLYNRNVNPNVKVDYQPVGSGSGIERYLDGSVDFAASDAPLTQQERAEFQNKHGEEPIQVPTVAGAVVFAYNVPQIQGETLKLSQDSYCGIVTGNITRWDHAEIAEDNPNLNLPDQDITWIHRSDGSGTNFIFTNHINTVCDNWDAGAAKSVNWPTGTGREGNANVAAAIEENEGAIGYVEYAHAAENNIPMASLQNQSGNFVKPTPDSASAIFKGQEIPDDFALLVPNPDSPDAYPIAGLTWLLIYPEYENANKYQALKQILKWSYEEGDPIASELGYAPISDNLVQEVNQIMENDVTVASDKQ